jgi:hypothetical protein
MKFKSAFCLWRNVTYVQVLRKLADIICISFTAGSHQASQQLQPVVKVEDQDQYLSHFIVAAQ